MADQDRPNQTSNKHKAEGERPGVDRQTTDEPSGITNRPIDEEIENQERVPDRGEAKEGAHAGHGPDRNRREEDDAEGRSER